MKTKREEKPVRISGQAPKGFTMRIREQTTGSWTWELKRWSTRVADGTTTSRKKAEQRLEEALGQHMLAAKKHQMRRGELLQRLRYWLERRTYVVTHVLYGLESGQKRGEVIASAAVEERALWKADNAKGIALDLPANHHRTKRAGEVAELCYDYCVQLGLVGKAAKTWGTKMMGLAFSAPDAESYVEVDSKNENEPRAKDFVEDEDDDAEIATPDTAND